MPQHHPSGEVLLRYATGSMGEPMALLVATHLALCPDCRRDVAAFEALGGAELEGEPPSDVDDSSLVRILAKIDSSPTRNRNAIRFPVLQEREHADVRLPQPLRGFLGEGLDALGWRYRSGIAEVSLFSDRGDVRTRLLRIKPGTAIPEHSHRGPECTLVLTGGFTDSTGHYTRGDVASADPSVQHRPVADHGEDCICLAVTEGSLQFTGPVARLLGPLFLR